MKIAARQQASTAHQPTRLSGFLYAKNRDSDKTLLPVSGNNPRFGGLTNTFRSLSQLTTDGLIRFFTNVTELYLWAYMAQDVLAMYVPRIRQSLLRGRIPYDMSQDHSPQNAGLSPMQQVRRTLIKNTQGLNWINFFEETIREFTTGPAAYLIPTLAFSWARRGLSRSPVELSHGTLTRMSQSFQASLANIKGNQGAANVMPRQAMAEHLKNWLLSCVDSDLTRKTVNGKTFGAYLQDFGGRWADAVLKESDITSRKVRIAHQKTFRNLYDELRQTVLELNRNHFFDTHLHNKRGMDELLLRFEKSFYQPIPGFTSDLDRFKGFLIRFIKAKTTCEQKGFLDTLPQLAEKLRRHFVVKKALLAVTVSVSVWVYLWHMAKLAQFYKRYEANRLLPLQQRALTNAFTSLSDKNSYNIHKPNNKADPFAVPPSFQLNNQPAYNIHKPNNKADPGFSVSYPIDPSFSYRPTGEGLS